MTHFSADRFDPAALVYSLIPSERSVAMTRTHNLWNGFIFSSNCHSDRKTSRFGPALFEWCPNSLIKEKPISEPTQWGFLTARVLCSVPTATKVESCHGLVLWSFTLAATSKRNNTSDATRLPQSHVCSYE